MRSYPEIGIWELVSGTPCFGPHCILRGQNPLTAWYLGPNTSSLAVKVTSYKALESLELVPGPVFLAFDGVDEATESSQIVICNTLKQLIENSGVSVKLLITGRDELGLLLMLDPSIPFARDLLYHRPPSH
jgi:hypothetical protein